MRRSDRTRQLVIATLVATLTFGITSPSLHAAAPRVVSEGEKLNDPRLGELKHLDNYFPFTPSKDAAAWKERVEYVRRQILVSNGLWPMPTRSPLKPVIHGRVDRDDYTVERVYMETVPGLYLTGSLYRPKNKTGKLPAVLCPHGHWSNGRFYDAGENGLKGELKSGAEKFDPSGRYPLQARCVHLARMGCVVFHYDMLGNADSVPLTQQLVHGFSKQRPELNATDRFGFFSAQAELRLQNVMGLQTFNSIRALDFLETLPDVDVKRIGVTGASGGGTQTFILAAIDERPAAAFPAVMVSTAMQGGCTCENACYLRIGTGNIEFAALCAPRPLAMSAANDWTVDIMTKGYPELKQHYAMLGAPNNVLAKYFDFGHNYNHPSRAMMYAWFKEHLKLGDVSTEERDFKPLSIEEMTVWNAENPKPKMDVEAELALTKALEEDSQKQIKALEPRDEKSLAEYRRVVGGGWDVIIGRRLSNAGEVVQEATPVKIDRGDYWEFGSLLHNKTHNECVPAAFFMPKEWKGDVVVWVDGDGKSALYDGDKPRAEVKQLLDAGMSVAAADLLYQGESQLDGKPLTEARRVHNNNREFAGYTYGYNHPVFCQRVHDVLTLLSFIKNNELHPPKRIHLLGVHNGGVLATAACAQSGIAIDRFAVYIDDFRFGDKANIRDVDFVPGAVKYGGLPGLAALCKTSATNFCLYTTPDRPYNETMELIRGFSANQNKGDAASFSKQPSQSAERGVNWLLAP
jgi:dienelactone hydrolase